MPNSWAHEENMDHIAQYHKRATPAEEKLELFLFGWRDAQGGGDDYGLNTGPCEKTFNTLISTTYMFQPNPAFTLLCRPYEMTSAQFEYVQEHDLDTQAFLEKLGPLPEIRYALDLSQYKDAPSALAALEDLLKN
ncbi:hypothetical protein [Terasakiella pusilla]|uniref:hypothetical protein n=1 Tax=Terasakiella pusilla TaxID=64973 RepID=UPI003AA9DF0B